MNLLVLCCVVAAGSLGAGAGGAGDGSPAPASALLGSRSAFDVQSTLLLGEAGGARRDVGVRLEGALRLEPVAHDPAADELLLRFTLEDVQLASRGAGARAEWQRRGAAWRAPDTAAYAQWRAGRLAAAFLARADPPDVRDYKRALLSLFQFQLVDGEYEETDVSGECDVTYETISPTVFRKTKRRCAFEASGAVRARRVSRYTLSDARDALAALHAEELLYVSADAGGAGGEGGAADDDEVAVKACSWHRLELRSAAPAAPSLGGAALAGALAALAELQLERTPLALPLPPEGVHFDDESLEDAVSGHGAALRGWRAGEGGAAAQAAALQPLLRALRAAPAPALHALLRREDLQDRLPGLCRALGLAGTRAAWDAARALLAPHAPDALVALSQHYLAGLALAPRAHPDVVAAALALAEEARLPAVAEAALLAGAGAAAGAGPDAARAARARLVRALERCRDAECRAAKLRALGNLRADAAALLVAAAERGAAREAEAALAALRGGAGGALGPALEARTALLAGDAARPLAVRALALELTLEGACARGRVAVPLSVVRVAHALVAERGAAAHELRRALWSRLATLEDRPAVRALRRLLPRDLRTWDARAHAGTSHVLVRELGRGGGGWSGALRSTQLASRALLLRGRVELVARRADEDEAELLAVEVWTRGLGALAGGGGAGDEGDEEEEGGPAAGLQVSVRGVALPPIALFEGQAELVGHIWSGAGAEPRGVARALLPLAALAARVPLQAGCALDARAEASAALALDAAGDASLWHRTGSARGALRAALSARAEARVRTAWAALDARADAQAEARLRIALDLEFYDEVALCVRAELAPQRTLCGVRLQAAGTRRAWRVRRNGTRETRRAGRTLALTPRNDAACRAHAPLDADDDD